MHKVMYAYTYHGLKMWLYGCTNVCIQTYVKLGKYIPYYFYIYTHAFIIKYSSRDHQGKLWLQDFHTFKTTLQQALAKNTGIYIAVVNL